MAPQDSAGRVPKSALVVSTLTLFILALGALLARLYIKIWVQKRFGSDDGLLIFAANALCGATGLLFSFIDQMYLVEALIAGLPGVIIPSDFIEQSTTFHKLSDACLILLWTTVCGVKFSFLALFRNLVDRNHPLTMYWRVALTLNIVIWLYGITGFIIPCPYFAPPQSLKCASGAELPKSVGLSALLVSLDILTDVSIIAIPVNIIWKVRISLKQRAVLALSLCLSFVMIIVTVVRVSGIVITSAQSIDVLWGIYWQYIEAAVAVIMASLTAFRSLFIIRGSGGGGHHADVRSYNGLKFLRKILSIWTWRRNSKEQGVHGLSDQELPTHGDPSLPEIPGALITGIRTFIRGAGVSQKSHAYSMQSHTQTLEGSGDAPPWHLYTNQSRNSIRVQHDVSLDFDRIDTLPQASWNQPEAGTNRHYA